MACYYFRDEVASCIPSYVIHCNVFCFLNKHTGSISSIADFFFPLFPTGHGLLAVKLACKGGMFLYLFCTVCLRGGQRKVSITIQW